LSDYLSPEVYAEVFSRKCQHINNFYGREVLRYLDYEVLDSDFIERNRFIGAPAGLFQQREMAHYNEAFSRHFQNEVVGIRRWEQDSMGKDACSLTNLETPVSEGWRVQKEMGMYGVDEQFDELEAMMGGA
jgi:hypothetical protein